MHPFRKHRPPLEEGRYSIKSGERLFIYKIQVLDMFYSLRREIRETFESARLEPHEFIEAGDLVVVPWAMHGRGRDGIELVARFTFVFTIRNGAIERMVMYQDKEDALEDLGLSEQDARADS